MYFGYSKFKTQNLHKFQKQFFINNFSRSKYHLDQSINETYSMFSNKPQTSFCDKFLFDISQLQYSTNRIITKLKNSRSHHHARNNFNLNHKQDDSSFISDKNRQQKIISNNNNNRSTMKKIQFRKRKFHLSEKYIFRKYQNVYYMPLSLMRSQNKIKDSTLQLSAISDQLKLIKANIQEFEMESFYSTKFTKAFKISNEKEKQKYNILLEETSVLLIVIQPKILQKIYTSLDQILYCRFPCLNEESTKQATNEDECLILNKKLFNKTTIYFNSCVEVFNIIQSQVYLIQFKYKQYFLLKVYLDLLRYNLTTLILVAKRFIDNYLLDEEMLNRFEESCELKEKTEKKSKNLVKSKLKKNNDLTDNINTKIKKICTILDFNKKSAKTQEIAKETKFHPNTSLKTSLLNLPLITEIMKYYDLKTKQMITAQRLKEHYQNID